jgi:hypothetical protein
MSLDGMVSVIKCGTWAISMADEGSEGRGMPMRKGIQMRRKKLKRENGPR